jgi:hypothetical protein
MSRENRKIHHALEGLLPAGRVIFFAGFHGISVYAEKDALKKL